VTAPWLRRGGASGLIFCFLWAPFALVLPLLPNLGSASEIEHFYRSHEALLTAVISLLIVAFVFFLGFLGALIEWLRQAEESGPLTWVVFASALMFMTGLNVALGLFASISLLSGTVGSETIHALHAGTFLLAAPAAGPGMAFFIAIAMLSFRTGAFPRWLAWVAVVAVLANVGALGGIFSLTGALNSGNGAVGGLPGPVVAWWLWTLLASWFLIARARTQPAVLSSSPARSLPKR
jgi:hypothetical protein